MRFTTCQYFETERVTTSIKNANASNLILDGMPVFANTFDQVTTDTNASPPTSALSEIGVDVRTYSTAGGSSIGQLFTGIAKVNTPNSSNVNSIPVGGQSEAVCYGFTDSVVVRRTRATSTDSWATVASFGAGDQLVPETANNYLTWSATAAIGAGKFPIVAGQSQNSLTTFASSANTNQVTGTAETVRMKVFINCM